ncbi:MAG: adenylate/guanylate cyclase domain-containing protein [Nanoarchaeota archaeon]
MITKNRYTSCISTGLIVVSVLSLLYMFGAFESLSQRMHDPLFGEEQPLPNIIILSIDDTSLQEIGRWPWNRSVFAELLTHLRTARAVGFDVMFAEISPDDKDFATALNNHGKVILAQEYTLFEMRGDTVTGKHALTPVPDLRDAAASLGIINVITDTDGITRAVNTNIQTNVSLFAQTLAHTLRNVDAPKTNRLLIKFIGSPKTFHTIPIADVLKDRIDDDVFNDSIILIGATASDLHDTYLVPTSQGIGMSGVEIHANLLQTILLESYLVSLPWWAIILCVFILSLIVSLCIARFHAWIAALISAILLFFYVSISVVLFEHLILTDLVFAPASIVISYAANLVNLFIREKKQKKEIFDAFNKYVSPAIINELLKHPEKLRLGGEKRTITIFFSDIRGFTSISEKLSPTALVDLLNEYLTAMTDIIMKHDGVVDKYMGDAIMAFWGAPLNQPNHAKSACTSALEMMEKLEELQNKWNKEGIPLLHIGIGLNTGPAVVGNMGSDKRFDYTCMGDTINLGSRLEGLNKEYGTSIIISESTRDALLLSMQGDQENIFILRELDRVQVKGRAEPLTIYELVKRKSEIDKKRQQAFLCFASGLALYREKKFEKAIVIFEKTNKICTDKTAKIYIDRCKYLQEHPPEENWNGVWVMKTK